MSDRRNTKALCLVLVVLFCLVGSSNASLAQDAASSGDWIKDRYHQSFRLEALGSYGDAITALAPVLESYPNGYAVNLRLGWLNYLAGADQESEQRYGMAVKIAPDALEPKIGLMLPLLAQGKWQQAESAAYRVMQEDPLNYYANLRLLIALRMQEKYALAVKQAEKLAVRYPADTLILQELGLSLLGQGENERAQLVLYDVNTLSPAQ